MGTTPVRSDVGDLNNLYQLMFIYAVAKGYQQKHWWLHLHRGDLDEDQYQTTAKANFCDNISGCHHFVLPTELCAIHKEKLENVHHRDLDVQ